jgi:hypothetical protein
MGDYSHFLAKLSSNGGPDPSKELHYIIEQCRRDPSSAGWLATYHRGHGFSRAGNSVCVIFHQPDQSSPKVEAVVARVLTREHVGSPPLDAEVRDYYEPWHDKLKGWWPLGGQRPALTNRDIVLTEFDSLEAIPGCQWKEGKTAPESFVAKASFVGWKFDETFNTLNWLQNLPGTRP